MEKGHTIWHNSDPGTDIFRQKVQSPNCIYCEENDDLHHTFFNCDTWALDKLNMEAELRQITPEVPKMLEGRANWENVSKYAERLLREKKADMETADRLIKPSKPKKGKKRYYLEVMPTRSQDGPMPRTLGLVGRERSLAVSIRLPLIFPRVCEINV